LPVRKTAQRDAAPPPPVDTRKTEELQAQIAEDQSKGGSVDLLDSSAPRE